MYKKIILLLIAAFALQTVDAQIFQTYKGKVRRMEKKLEKDTSDIVLDPIEQIPEHGTKRFNIEAAQSNWGVDLLRPQAIADRMANECTNHVTVKVADTAFDWDHFDLSTAKLPGANYTTDANGADQNGHSTHCAGIIAARDFGYTWPLVARGIIKLKPVQVLSGSGSGSFDWIKNAVAGERQDDRSRLAAGESVVWSGSFGGGTALLPTVESELKASTDIGVLFCFAAGNTGTPGVNYPGNGAYSMAVGSLDQSLTVSSYSSRGAEVLVAAPGRSILSTYKGNTYATLSGTSMATPAEAAMLAIALSKWGRVNLATVTVARNYLAWCAKDILPAGKDNDTGWGLDLIENILNRNPADTPVVVPPPPPPPPPDTIKPPPPPPVHTLRTLSFDLDAGYDVLWFVPTGAAAVKSQAETFMTAGRGSTKAHQQAALTRTRITGFTVEVQSTSLNSFEYAATKARVQRFFTNRGFGLATGSDAADAVFWASYFLELILEKEQGVKLDVVNVTGKDLEGNPIKFSGANLKHWPIK